MNQLEEVIDQKNEKIEMLNGQLQSLTATTQKEGEADIGTLQRQLLKMEHSMKVYISIGYNCVVNSYYKVSSL